MTAPDAPAISAWSRRWPLLAVLGAAGVAVWFAIPKAAPEAGRLVGRWVRDEGGYVLEVKSAVNDGRAEVVYRNPEREKPIHVARSSVAREDGLKLFIELRDEGYPGSTYTLAFDPADGRLKGEYYQAQQGSRFAVSFSRAP
jgi:hypothetical protein